MGYVIAKHKCVIFGNNSLSPLGALRNGIIVLLRTGVKGFKPIPTDIKIIKSYY